MASWNILSQFLAAGTAQILSAARRRPSQWINSVSCCAGNICGFGWYDQIEEPSRNRVQSGILLIRRASQDRDP